MSSELNKNKKIIVSSNNILLTCYWRTRELSSWLACSSDLSNLRFNYQHFAGPEWCTDASWAWGGDIKITGSIQPPAMNLQLRFSILLFWSHYVRKIKMVVNWGQMLPEIMVCNWVKDKSQGTSQTMALVKDVSGNGGSRTPAKHLPALPLNQEV